MWCSFVVWCILPNYLHQVYSIADAMHIFFQAAMCQTRAALEAVMQERQKMVEVQKKPLPFPTFGVFPVVITRHGMDLASFSHPL